MVAASNESAERRQCSAAAGIDDVIHSMPGLAFDQRPLQQFSRDVIPRFA